MSNNQVIATLIEFFREEFSEDAAGVGEWLAQNGQDADEFIRALEEIDPYSLSD